MTRKRSAIWIRHVRQALGLGQKELARLCGVSAQSVYLWEAGRSLPRGHRLAVIERLAPQVKR